MSLRRWLVLLAVLLPTGFAMVMAGRNVLAAELHRRQVVCELEARRVLSIQPGPAVHLCRMLWLL